MPLNSMSQRNTIAHCNSMPTCNSMPQCVNMCDCKNSESVCTPGKPDTIGNGRPGMAYVNFQKWGKLYDMPQALCEGTAFPDLNLVFIGTRGKCR